MALKHPKVIAREGTIQSKYLPPARTCKIVGKKEEKEKDLLFTLFDIN